MEILSSNITIMVSNMDAAVKFYTDGLGFKLKNRYGDHWADVEAPGMSIGLHPANKEVKTGDRLSIGFKVNDLNQVVKTLEQRGLQFRIHDDGQVLLAHFNDPDGNAMYLAQSKW